MPKLLFFYTLIILYFSKNKRLFFHFFYIFFLSSRITTYKLYIFIISYVFYVFHFYFLGAFNVVPTPTLTGPIGIPTPIPIPVQDDKVKIIRTVKIIFFNLFKIFSFENNSVIITKLCNFNYNQHYLLTYLVFITT